MPDPTTPGGEMPAGAAIPPTTPTTPPPTAPQAPTPPPQTTPPPASETLDGEEFDPQRAMALITKLRQEAKDAVKATKELEQLREEKRQADLAKLSEQERLSKRADDAERALQEAQRAQQQRINRYEVQLQASRLGIVDPEAAVRLLDWDALEYATDGTPKDVEQVLKQLVKDRPYLAGQAPGQPSAAPTNPATRAANPSARIYTAAELADREFYSAHRDDIVKAYREGRVTN